MLIAGARSSSFETTNVCGEVASQAKQIVNFLHYDLISC